VHDEAANANLEALFNQSWLLTHDIITAVRCHYGEEIALIFGFYDLANRALIPPALCGVLVYSLRFLPNASEHAAIALAGPLYGAFMVLWGAVLLMLWKHERARLVHAWGVSSFVSASYERPQFECWHDAATGNPRFYPPWRRHAKRLLSMGVTLLQVGVLATLTALLYVHYVTSTEFLTGLSRKFWASGVNGLLYGALVMGLELYIFRAVSERLTEFENYRTQSEHEASLVFKVRTLLSSDLT
jgi:hypothetical protein